MCDPHRFHYPWECNEYNTPKKIRERHIEICVACGVRHGSPQWKDSQWNDSNGKPKDECHIEYILQQNRGQRCNRCGDWNHLFWTCDGYPHPGSQFKTSNKTAYEKTIMPEVSKSMIRRIENREKAMEVSEPLDVHSHTVAGIPQNVPV